MTKARLLRGQTQAEVAERMSRNTDTKWTKTSVALAEGSVGGSRIRAFTAVELVALARTFDLPVTYFLAPPENREQHHLDLPGVPSDAWEYLVLLVAGHENNAETLGRQYSDSLGAINVAIPTCDMDPSEIDSFTADVRAETRLSPTDIMAAALHGLMLTNTRGAPPAAGDTLNAWISTLKSLQFALEAFQGYDPGQFVNPKMAEEIAAKRERALETDQENREAAWREIESERAAERQRLLQEGRENEP